MARLAGGRSHIGFQNSWYYDSAAHRTSSPRLEDSITVDVCVIGGYTGLSAAIELARAGANVALLERHEVGSGASGRNGGVWAWVNDSTKTIWKRWWASIGRVISGSYPLMRMT